MVNCIRTVHTGWARKWGQWATLHFCL